MLRKVPTTVGNLRISTALPIQPLIRIQPSRPVSTDYANSKPTTSEKTVTWLNTSLLEIHS